MRTGNQLSAVAAGVALCVTTIATAENDFFRLVAPVETTITAIRGDGTIEWTGTVSGVTGTVQRTSNPAVESNWTDYVRFEIAGTTGSLKAIDPNPPAGTAYNPDGSLSMGDAFTEGETDERPVHTVFVSAFYIDKTEAKKAMWDEVRTWATANGYAFDKAGQGKAANHPVHTVSWFDAVKWCNARSQKEELTPCYTVGGAVYKTGQSAPDCNWSADGYRLPTEAEWEKAARGGAHGRRLPWVDSDTIQHARATYFSSIMCTYDTSPTRGYPPNYETNGIPYTSPVGSIAANGYGLFDMAGNVAEWCWDWYGSYASEQQSDPRGPVSGVYRVVRGGSWNDYAWNCRTASRYFIHPSFGYNILGFRTVRALSP
ncbi:MAG: formylglycine-generating enzyme family protein [Verrucomicrobia bacterium]|nr:formylglycine-generating enzyme family protein [Verrucomicrobiota bacterium]